MEKYLRHFVSEFFFNHAGEHHRRATMEVLAVDVDVVFGDQQPDLMQTTIEHRLVERRFDWSPENSGGYRGACRLLRCGHIICCTYEDKIKRRKNSFKNLCNCAVSLWQNALFLKEILFL